MSATPPPCPSCGRPKPLVRQDRKRWRVICPCWTSGPAKDTREEAVSAWKGLADPECAALELLADIRAAVGDPEGRLMQDELVQRCRDLAASSAETPRSKVPRLNPGPEPP